jgi:hypothetical protein
MAAILHFLNLAAISVEVLLVFAPPLAILILLGLIWAVAGIRSVEREQRGKLVWPLFWALSQFLFPAAILICGIVWEDQNWAGQRNPYMSNVITFLVWAQLPVTAVLACLWRRCWWLICSLALAAFAYSLAAAFVSEMSITGGWL